VERNAQRANLVGRAEDWRWSSLWHRQNRSRSVTMAAWSVSRGRKWIEYVNDAETEAELQALRRSVQRGTPFGTTVWQLRTAKRLGLESSLRDPGRPRKKGVVQKVG
jgi:putative transposase